MDIHGNETQLLEMVPQSSTGGTHHGNEDVLICGRCAYQCSDLRVFVTHKQQCKNSPQKSESPHRMVSTITSEPSVQNLQNTFVNISLGSPHMVVQGPFKIIMDGNQSSFPDILNGEDQIPLNGPSIKLDDLHALQQGPLMKEELASDPSVLGLDLSSWDKGYPSTTEGTRTLTVSADDLVPANQSEEEDVANFLANQMAAQKTSENHQSDRTTEFQQQIDVNAGDEKDVKTRPKTRRKKQSQKESYISLISREEGTHLCCVYPKCTFRTVHRKNIVRHYATHSDVKAFTCTKCPAKFSRKDKLKLHERIHTGEKPYACPKPGCGYRAIENNCIVKHARTHTKERPYQCQLCPYKGKDQSQLLVHLRFHTGDTPFHCPEEGCSSAFATSSDLKRHSYVHSGIKPYACAHCKYRTNLKHNLNTHVQVTHMENPRYSCSFCSFVGTTRKQCRDHLKTHTGKANSRPKYTRISRSQKMEKPYKCDICGSGFVRADSFRSHMRQHHRNDQVKEQSQLEVPKNCDKPEESDTPPVESQDKGPLQAYVITINGVSSTVHPQVS